MAKSKMKKKRKKIDEIWLVLMVMIVVLILSIVIQRNELRREAEDITNLMTNNNDLSFAPNNVVYEEKLEKISDMSYSELKETLNVENDFCIYFEDEDGNLIEVKDGIKSIGSGLIEINGEPCGR